MTVHSRKRGMLWQRRCPVSPGCAPQPVSALPGRMRTESSCRSPSEQGPPGTAMAGSRASISGSPSTGCRQAESPGTGGTQQAEQGCAQAGLHGRRQVGMQREQPTVPMNN